MPRKTYYLENLGCANCAAKMEARINALPGVQAQIVFPTRQLRVTAEDPDALLPQLKAIIQAIEPQVHITDHPSHDHHEHTHDHGDHQHHDHDHRNEESLLPLLVGAALFAAGLVLEFLGLGLWSLCAFVPAYLLLGWEVLSQAAKNLVQGQVFDENFLMSIATLVAFAIGEFPEAAGVMLFYRVGEYFEHRAVARSRRQIMEAVDLRPEQVLLVTGNEVRSIPAEQAQVGDILLIRPGDRIGLDGTVISGQSRIDTAPITGEPVPVAVAPGDPVTSGCVNGSGQLHIQVTKPLSESMVTRILEAVENAAAGKPRLDRFISRFCRVYTPVVVTAAVLTAVIPSLIDGRWSHWIYTALSFLVMSCPCALVLSVPLSFFCGIGTGSRRGILFKDGAAIEAMAKVRHVMLDKTGTLTDGSFRVRQVVGTDDLLRLCASCEQHSAHPIAQSIVAAALEQRLPLEAPDELEEIPGFGIRATVAGHAVLCGSLRLLERFGISADLPEGNGTWVYAALDGAYAGAIRISDELKPGAKEAVNRLKAMGLGVTLLTGDSEQGAAPVAQALDISAQWELLPQQKLEALQACRTEAGGVLFVGDGINDSPVLAGADVGAAMGSGADAAIEAADVVFLTSQVGAIADAVALSRRTQRIAWQGILFALAVKLLVIVLGLFGFASMWLAVFADSGVALLCVLNSLRLLRTKNS